MSLYSTEQALEGVNTQVIIVPIEFTDCINMSQSLAATSHLTGFTFSM